MRQGGQVAFCFSLNAPKASVSKGPMRKSWVIVGFLVLAVLVLLWMNRSPVPIIWKVPVKGLGGDALAVASDGTVYETDWPGGVLQVYNTAGKLKLTSPNSVCVDSVPVIGRDGTIYLRETFRRFRDGSMGTSKGLLALNPDCSVKWRFPITDIETAGGSGTSFALGNHDAVYFSVSGGFNSSKSLYAVNSDGRELWHFDSEGNATAPVVVADDDSVLFHSAGSTNARVYRFDPTGPVPIQTAQLQQGSGSFSVGWDGAVYLPGGIGNTLTALNRDGSLCWHFRSPFRAFGAPTIGPDGSLYFTARTKTSDTFLIALSRGGEEKWKLGLGSHWSFASPAIGSDGTLFEVSSDPKVTAINPGGTVKWVFKPPRRFPMRWPESRKDFKKLMSEDFGDGMNVLTTAPALTPDGRLYICLGGPYNALYCLNVGVGLATNSPWPMQGGDLRLTRHVASRLSTSTTDLR
jgi:outer membrane protein assembly factor BamB